MSGLRLTAHWWMRAPLLQLSLLLFRPAALPPERQPERLPFSLVLPGLWRDLLFRLASHQLFRQSPPVLPFPPPAAVPAYPFLLRIRPAGPFLLRAGPAYLSPRPILPVPASPPVLPESPAVRGFRRLSASHIRFHPAHTASPPAEYSQFSAHKLPASPAAQKSAQTAAPPVG